MVPPTGIDAGAARCSDACAATGGLKRHRRTLLRGVEHAHRTAMEDNLYRYALMGKSALINASWDY